MKVVVRKGVCGLSVAKTAQKGELELRLLFPDGLRGLFSLTLSRPQASEFGDNDCEVH